MRQPVSATPMPARCSREARALSGRGGIRRLVAGALMATTLASGQALPKKSGLDYATPAVAAMQRDDTLNPALLWLQAGQQAWDSRDGVARSCASCHGDVQQLRGVATRYPAFDEGLQRPVTLAQRIDQCRTRHQQASAWPAESEPRLAVELLVANASRGLPIRAVDDPRLAAALAQGRQIYHQRLGQLDLSCAQCHTEHAEQRLAGSAITQGQATGYPIYRLEWQGLGSLQRRLRACFNGVRAEPFAADAPQSVALELYLRQRAAGLPIETPGVRP